MIDMEKHSGLPIKLDGVRIVLGSGVAVEKTSQRTLDEMKPFLMDDNAKFPKKTAYYMYRNVGFPKDRQMFSKNKLRFDLTVLENGLIGREFARTIGHYHPFKPGTAVRYPEIYEIVTGEAMFMMQETGSDENRVKSVLAVSAGQGDKVLMPPGFGHVTVNVGKTPLVTANIVSDEFGSVYTAYRENHGPAYYVVEDQGKPVFLRNESYGRVPAPQLTEPRQSFRGTLYAAASRDISKFSFLHSPEKFADAMKVEKLFELKR
ncbi:MAG: glucose-6-phosphate isomerase [Candidatus Aenigmarchaeota archaeon]|nr:glucose-6-phosphate isomerase [Candidatus Aenigmarchaeota archaeon]